MLCIYSHKSGWQMFNNGRNLKIKYLTEKIRMWACNHIYSFAMCMCVHPNWWTKVTIFI